VTPLISATICIINPFGLYTRGVQNTGQSHIYCSANAISLGENRLFILLIAATTIYKWDSLYVCMRMQDPNTIFYVMPFHVAMHDAAAVARDRIAEMAYA
jgi:hypothetical protein